MQDTCTHLHLGSRSTHSSAVAACLAAAAATFSTPTPCSFAEQVLLEFKEYATEVDVDFVRKAVRAIGYCAVSIPSAAERWVQLWVWQQWGLRRASGLADLTQIYVIQV